MDREPRDGALADDAARRRGLLRARARAVAGGRPTRTGATAGCCSQERVEHELRDGRPALTAARVSVDSPPWRIDASATLEAALRSDGLRRLGAIIAVDSDGILRGVLTLPRIRRAMNPSAAYRVRPPPHARARRPHNRRGPRRAAGRARRRARGRVGRDHEQGPPGALALGGRRRRHQRRDQRRRRLALARLRHGQGLRLPRRPGRDRGDVQRGAGRGHAPRAHRRDLPPQRDGRDRPARRSAAPR